MIGWFSNLETSTLLATRKRRILLLVLSVLVISCAGVCLVAGYRFAQAERRPAPDSEAIFGRYLSSPRNDILLREATAVQGKELGMGQGVYLRFEASKSSVLEFLTQEEGNEGSPHYPFVAIPCQEFYDAYEPRADETYEWWRPRDALSPECYVTVLCEFFMVDSASSTVHYYYFPDFLGKDFYCVNAQGEREPVRK